MNINLESNNESNGEVTTEESYPFYIYEEISEFFSDELSSIFDFKNMMSAFIYEYNLANPDDQFIFNKGEIEIFHNLSNQLTAFVKEIIMVN